MKIRILLVLVVVLVALPVTTAQATSDQGWSCQQWYTVQKGDTLSGIAQANGYGSDWLQIAQSNSLRVPYVIWPGMRLCLPVYTAPGQIPIPELFPAPVPSPTPIPWWKLPRNYKQA